MSSFLSPVSAPAPAPRRPVVRSAADVAALGVVLGVWAHPDDETYLSGGLMAAARDADRRVVCVTATRGELGTPDPVRWPPDRLAAERTVELTRSLAVLGVREHHWLGYADGGCAGADAGPAVERLCEVIDDVRPDTVLTFGPDGQTGHPDHRTVSGWTTAAFRHAAPTGSRLLYSAVEEGWARRWAPVNDRLGVFLGNVPATVAAGGLAVALELSGDALERKVRSLQAQATQTTGVLAALGPEDYAAWVAEEAFVEVRVAGA